MKHYGGLGDKNMTKQNKRHYFIDRCPPHLGTIFFPLSPKTFKNSSPIWCNNEDSRHFPSNKLDGKKARKMY
jgi:hypothetical protein